jgi:hypothetical protein
MLLGFLPDYDLECYHFYLEASIGTAENKYIVEFKYSIFDGGDKKHRCSKKYGKLTFSASAAISTSVKGIDRYGIKWEFTTKILTLFELHNSFIFTENSMKTGKR